MPLPSITIRGLTQSEIPTWSDFCAFCFSHKKPTPPPASYFQGHFDNDPYRVANLVRVAIDTDDSDDFKIASSVRVFVRTVGTGSATDDFTLSSSKRTVGGIGEVCTHVDYRRQGIASALLNDAFDQMKAKKMDCTLLHVSNPSLQVVYQKQGYVSVLSPWSTIPVSTIKNIDKSIVVNEQTEKQFKIRSANFGNDDDVESLYSIHQKYSENRFAGCIERSIQYWKEYISKELNNQLCVLEVLNNGNPRICAWLSIRKRGDKYQVREFGVDHTILDTYEAMTNLLPSALLNLDCDTDMITLHLPTTILEETKTASVKCNIFDWNNVQDEDDCGWMYKELGGRQPSMAEICKTVPHLIWPSDSF